MVETATPTTNPGFNTDWASPPGELIEEVLEEFGWSRAELAQRLDFSAKHVNELLKGPSADRHCAGCKAKAGWTPAAMPASKCRRA
jgi:hypothetical protein